MAALMLVDLDSVFGAGRPHSASLLIPASHPNGIRFTPDEGAGEPSSDPEHPSVVVAVVMTTEVVKSHPITFRYVRRFAAHLASLLEPSRAPDGREVLTEQALLLPMPGACSAAIGALFLRAGSAAAAVGFDALWLLTADPALAREVERQLGSSWRSTPDAGREGGSPLLLRGWSGKRRQRPFVVPAMPPAREDDPGPHPPPPAFSAPVATRAEALWARDQEVEVGIRDLGDIARIVDGPRNRVPALLSQISITQNTVRGVGRMGHHAGTTALFGDVRPQDGVELRRGPPPGKDDRLSVFMEAAIGTGAVTFVDPNSHSAWGRATLRTSLPAAVVHDLAAKVPLRTWTPGLLDDRGAFRRVDPNVSVGDLFEVAFHADGRVEVPQSFGWRPNGWWLTGKLDKPIAHAPWEGKASPLAGRIPRHQLPASAALVVKARMARVLFDSTMSADVVVPTSPLPRDTAVVLRHKIQPFTLGHGVARDAVGKSFDVAVFALNEPLAPGIVTCSPVQIFSAHALCSSNVEQISHNEWDDLRKLPLLVPVRPGLG